MKWKINWLLNKMQEIDKQRDFITWSRLFDQYMEAIHSNIRRHDNENKDKK